MFLLSNSDVVLNMLINIKIPTAVDIYEHGKCSVRISERGSNREHKDINGRQPNQEAG